MHRILAVLVTCALILGGVASAAHAQFSSGAPSTRWITFGIGGGVSVPVEDVEAAFDNGYAGQGFVRMAPAGIPFAFRLDFTYQSFDLKSVQVASPTTSIGTSEILGGLAMMQMDLMQGPVRPYILAGLGAYNLSIDPDDPSTDSSSDTQFGINGGAGLSLQVSAIRLYVEGRVDNVYTEEGFMDTDAIQVVPVTFGLIF